MTPEEEALALGGLGVLGLWHDVTSGRGRPVS